MRSMRGEPRLSEWLMANLNSASVREAKVVASALTTRRKADTVAIHFVVDDNLDQLPPSLRDLVYEGEYGAKQNMASANEGKLCVGGYDSHL